MPPGYRHPGGAYPQPPSCNKPPTRKQKVWLWIVGAAVGVFVLAFGGCVAFLAAVGDSLHRAEPTADSASGPTRPDGESGGGGPHFPGKQPNDTAAHAGVSVTVEGVTTTTTPLFDRSQYSSDFLCTTVTVSNESKKSQSFNVWDWKLQDPSGTARNCAFTGSDNQLNSGEVAAGGGTTVGDVCFDEPQGSPSGTYVVLFDPTFTLSSDRVAWINAR
jgi:hypothetical protein